MKLLILDDEPLALHYLKNLIARVLPESHITTFLGAEPALDYLAQHPVDIAFLDIELSDINGLEMAKRMTAMYPQTNIVFVTGFSHYALDAFDVYASAYLLKPVTTEKIAAAIKNLRFPLVSKTPTVRIQTFGNFEIFVKNKPLKFPRSKSKELFAYLVDRRGACATTGEIAAVLFEDKLFDRSLQSQTQTLISVMMRTLREAGVAEIIIKTRNNLAIDVSKVSCDLYDYLKAEGKNTQPIPNEYMSNYSWSEFTMGVLFQQSH